MIAINIEKKMRTYHGFNVLKVDARFDSGGIVSISGPSGCGKTTLLKVVAGLVHPEKGEIMVNDVTWLNTQTKVLLSPQKRKTGFVFQNYALFPNMTVRQHLEYATTDAEWITTLLHFARLETLTTHKPQYLSGGQQQRLAIIRALAIKPKLLLMDEPFSALDYDMRVELIRQLKVLLSAMDTTCFIVTHNPQELAEIATERLTLL